VPGSVISRRGAAGCDCAGSWSRNKRVRIIPHDITVGARKHPWEDGTVLELANTFLTLGV